MVTISNRGTVERRWDEGGGSRSRRRGGSLNISQIKHTDGSFSNLLNMSRQSLHTYYSVCSCSPCWQASQEHNIQFWTHLAARENRKMARVYDCLAICSTCDKSVANTPLSEEERHVKSPPSTEKGDRSQRPKFTLLQKRFLLSFLKLPARDTFKFFWNWKIHFSRYFPHWHYVLAFVDGHTINWRGGTCRLVQEKQ